MKKEIYSYNDFIKVLLQAGFSMGGGNAEGIYAAVSWNWNEEPPYDTPVRWHTEDLETDPWEWRMRVLDERNDIAYAKLFFKKSGYITKEFYPYFLAARREGQTLEEEYEKGMISHYAKKIYQIILEHGTLPLHAIKQIGEISKEDKSKFDRAMIELQMKMYLTMCGKQQKLSQKGAEYGWSSTVFCTVEDFFGEEMVSRAAKIEKQEAIARITEQVYTLNPEAQEKKILKFIQG
ncbi:hypothetical protein [Faecalicatena contorta]